MRISVGSREFSGAVDALQLHGEVFDFESFGVSSRTPAPVAP